MVEQSFKNIDGVLHKDAGCSSKLAYGKQTSWILFLRYLESLKQTKIRAATLTNKKCTNIISIDGRLFGHALKKR
jgi:type I restriction enzyme M protein